ncbi:NAD(P)/FAD-dependent oxidoreductase [Trinickia fusca]|uniref:FAD-binding oxidoreductase n=1 Tax=Trinickia fusca TaxID=2419777 RepID=A0A494XAY8_9BURK|nr:FAD-dependent oxidoreductase [Trinickia fusca]RKP45259.1 FAD-binding oxidoreductase [Trinickia fusca]
MRRTEQYDLAIVGGGIIGAWTLYLAATRFPNWRTVLIERSTIGSGATAHSAGVWVAIGRTPIERALATRSMHLYAQVRAQLNIDMTPAKSYWVSSSHTFDAARESILDLGGAGHEIMPAELASQFDFSVRIPDGERIQLGGTPASCDPGGIARALVAYGRRQSQVSCWEGIDVSAVRPAGDGVDIALANGDTVAASRAVVAVGPWLPAGLVPASISSSVRIKRVVALHVDKRPPPDAPALFFPDADAYLMPLQTRQQWLFSFHRKQWGCRPDDVEQAVNAADEDEALAALRRYLPELAAHCRGGRAFCDAYAQDGEPVIAASPDAGQIVIAGAGAGKGFRLSPGIAEAALARLAS